MEKFVHDLRNPLAPLVAGIEILKTRSSDPEQLQILEMMREQTRQLVSMLDGMVNPEMLGTPNGVRPTSPSRVDASKNEVPLVPSLLIIDDNPNILVSLKLLFEERGYQVMVATKAEDAIALTEEFKPLVCLSDISLPTADGFEAASELMKAHDGMRMFSMSGFNSPDDRERSKEVGFLRHFSKPLVFDEVAQIIEHALSRPK